MGGPGVLVWMWVTALIGSMIKFYSCSLSVQLREVTQEGDPLGGPMYYMRLGIRRWGKPMAIWFSIAGLFGVLPAFTANQLTQTLVDVVAPNQYLDLGVIGEWKLVIGIILCLLSSWVIFGGLQKIVRVTSGLVPVMVVLYLSMGVYILVDNASLIIPTFVKIFDAAFTWQTAATGGFWGLVILGVRRASILK